MSRNLGYALSAAAIIAFALVLVLNNFVNAEPVAADQQDVTAPSNGTANSVNLSMLAQQYIGFFGNVTMQVRKPSSGSALYNRTVLSGCVFVNDGDVAAPAWPAVQSPTDFNSDNNFSLSGAYVTANHYNTVFGSLCGVANVFTLNTTDNFAVGIFRDTNGTNSRHFIGSNIRNVVSTNGFGHVQYEIIVPKTASYGDSGYDFYIELG